MRDGRELEQHWAVIEREGRLVLQFFSGSRLVVELLRQPDGSWRGRIARPSGFDARLVAERGVAYLAARQRRARFDARRRLRSGRCSIRRLFATRFRSGDRAGIAGGALSAQPRCATMFPSSSPRSSRPCSCPQDWRVALEALAETLKEARDARMSRTPQDLVAPSRSTRMHYTRVF